MSTENTEKMSAERQIFDWRDSGGMPHFSGVYEFYECVLKVPIGRFKVGATFPIICVDYQSSTITLCTTLNNGTSEVYSLISIVGAEK